MVDTVASQQEADGFTPAAVLNPELFLSGACMLYSCVFVCISSESLRIYNSGKLDKSSMGVNVVLYLRHEPCRSLTTCLGCILPFHLPVTL